MRSASSGVGDVIASQVNRAGSEPVRMVVSVSPRDSVAGSMPGHVRRQPLQQLRRERNEQHRVADHRGIEGIRAEAAEQMLGEQDRERSAADDQPPRRERRQAQREQHCRDDRAAVEQERRQSACRAAAVPAPRRQRRRDAEHDLHSSPGPKNITCSTTVGTSAYSTCA